MNFDVPLRSPQYPLWGNIVGNNKIHSYLYLFINEIL